MTTLTDYLAQVKSRAEAATDGPWENDGGGDIGQHWSRPEPWEPIVSKAVMCGSFCMGGSAAGVVEPADAEFIAHARTDVPTLAAMVERVLELHEPMEDTVHGITVCSHEHCRDLYSDQLAYPCPAVAAMQEVIADE